MANYFYKQEILRLDAAIQAASPKVIRVFINGGGLLNVETSEELDQSEKDVINAAIQAVPAEILPNDW